MFFLDTLPLSTLLFSTSIVVDGAYARRYARRYAPQVGSTWQQRTIRPDDHTLAQPADLFTISPAQAIECW